MTQRNRFILKNQPLTSADMDYWQTQKLKSKRWSLEKLLAELDQQENLTALIQRRNYLSLKNGAKARKPQIGFFASLFNFFFSFGEIDVGYHHRRKIHAPLSQNIPTPTNTPPATALTIQGE